MNESPTPDPPEESQATSPAEPSTSRGDLKRRYGHLLHSSTASIPRQVSPDSLRKTQPPPPAPPQHVSSSSNGLASAMARIHSQNQEQGNSPTASSTRPGSSSFLKRAGSTLPPALAKIRWTHSTLPEALRQPQRPKDPLPGKLGAMLWFWFRFGRYANSVLATVPLLHLLLWSALWGWAAVGWAAWLSPLDPGPNSVYTGPFLLKMLALVVAGGGLSPLLFAVLLAGLARTLGGGLGFLQALRMVLAAAAPMAGVAGALWSLALLVHGEAFWRGNVPTFASFSEISLLPTLALWTGWRLVQGLVRLGGARPSASHGVLLPLSLLFALAPPLLLRLPSFSLERSRQATEQAMRDSLRHRAQGGHADRESLDLALERLPRRSVDLRSHLLAFRLESLASREWTLEARADAWRLQRLHPRGSAWEQTARGINLVLGGRPDLGRSRLEAGLLLDPSLSEAHFWLARVLSPLKPSNAEHHAAEAWKLHPNSLNLAVWIGILHDLRRNDLIWAALESVELPPEEWFTSTLFQVGLAAMHTGNNVRGRILLDLAFARDPSLRKGLPPEFLSP